MFTSGVVLQFIFCIINLRITYASVLEVLICFSVQVEKDINKLSKMFQAQIKAGKEAEVERLFMLQNSMESREFDELLGLKHSPKKRSTPFKQPAEDGKLYSNYFTHVLIKEQNERVWQPMRYRVRPEGSREEVPSKFNVFNARLDALEIRQTWKPLFMRRHGLIPFNRFYEWVPGKDQKTTLISFGAREREVMWAPCLWDEWISKDGRIHFKSFAIITDDPPREILEMGHDRCPIFLAQEKIDLWLEPQGKSKSEIYQLLKTREPTCFDYRWESEAAKSL